MALRFDNAFVRELPADPVRDNRPRPVRGAVYSLVDAEPAKAPSLVAWVPEVAALLDLPSALDDAARSRWAAILAGNETPEGTTTWATRYGGHQFGTWAGQLGDGRALSIGEVVTSRHGRRELQLKGAGRTPYSRRGDGRAVLRSSLRELVCSEAMHHLGVPGTRALSLVLTGDRVVRDMFYDGNPEHEPGAVVCRVAPTFIRFGHFQMPAADGDLKTLRALYTHVVKHHFPGFSSDVDDVEGVLAWFEEVCARTVAMVVHWQRVGFVHGVMNTDNMSITGLTIDYGPFGFLEPVDPRWTPNTTDESRRRYAYGNQPSIALWNLERLAEAVLTLVVSGLGEEAAPAALSKILERTSSHMTRTLIATYGQKLGLKGVDADAPLVERALDVMERAHADFTLFFRALGGLSSLPRDASGERLLSLVEDALYQPPAGDPLVVDFLRALRAAYDDGESPESRRARMDRWNPAIVPRNWLLQEAIDALTAGDGKPLHALLDVCRTPYATVDANTPRAHYTGKRPAWAETKPGCAMLSCSS